MSQDGWDGKQGKSQESSFQECVVDRKPVGTEDNREGMRFKELI